MTHIGHLLCLNSINSRTFPCFDVVLHQIIGIVLCVGSDFQEV